MALASLLLALAVAARPTAIITLNGGYEGHSATQEVTLRNMMSAIYGLMRSANRGILVFSPVLIAGFGGLVMVLVRRRVLVLEYVAVATLLTTIEDPRNMARFSQLAGSGGRAVHQARTSRT